MDLIATNVYNSVKAPAQRGLSYIEIWMLGIQIPILVGIFEYGILLAMKKYHQFETGMLRYLIKFSIPGRSSAKLKETCSVPGMEKTQSTYSRFTP